MNSQTQEAHEVMLLMSLLVDEKETSDLLSFLPDTEQAPLKKELTTYLSLNPKDRHDSVFATLKKFWNKKNGGSLFDIHPDWIMDALLEESPRTVGTILRYLPSEKTSRLIETMPEAFLQRLPKLSETFSLDPDLVRILKLKFEKSFEKEVPKNTRPFDFLVTYNEEKILKFFKTLGLKELALAFSVLPKEAMDAILSRLPGNDALALREKMKKETGGPDRKKKAQSHVLDMNLDTTNPDLLLVEAGFYVFTKALLAHHRILVDFIMKKISKMLGNRLKYYLEKNLPLNSEESVKIYQEEVCHGF